MAKDYHKIAKKIANQKFEYIRPTVTGGTESPVTNRPLSLPGPHDNPGEVKSFIRKKKKKKDTRGIMV
jgi:hypothetical protein